MSTPVLYTPQNRRLDLSRLDGRDFALIRSLHRQIRRGDRTLLCLRAATGGGAEMHVRVRDGRYWAVHFPGGDCGLERHRISRESDEHRRQKDYWQRAAEDAGYRAWQEHRTEANTILDVAIEGPRRTGVEVQHSTLETSVVKTRTTKSFNVGWLPVWFLDSDNTPPWFHQVPALGCNTLRWSSLPVRRSATAFGPSRFVALACRVPNFGSCPADGRSPCGKHHPRREPWRGLTVDDIAEMIPAREMVPMRDLLGHVHLVSPENLALFQDLTGTSGEYRPGSAPAGVRAAAGTTTCVNPDHDDPSPGPLCSKCGRAPVGPGRVLCPACLHRLRNRSYYDTP
ncbi:hypothetical protein [Umezawaea sp.]|uniref:hypothetical protein n=1 Tax=Umezawaea sp. TaxID=1955258 RepID=UPI002ED58B94